MTVFHDPRTVFRVARTATPPFVARCARDTLFHVVVHVHHDMRGTHSSVAWCDEWRHDTGLAYTACVAVAAGVAPTCLVCANRRASWRARAA